MDDQETRALLDRHWAASATGDYEREHHLYEENAVLEYPQSGERIRGRANIAASRAEHPAKRRFEIHRVFGSGDTWVTEYVIVYDERPYHTVSLMELSNGKVIRETQYFADAFPAPAWRSRWVERIDTQSRQRGDHG